MKAKLRTAVIGLGGRGMGLMHTVLRMKDVEVVAVCDLYEDRVNKALAAISKRVGSARGETDYCKLLDKRNVDAMLVTTAWSAHSEIAFAAMEAGIPVGCEVGGAYSVEECFRLVEVSERTGTPYMMLENCCYGEYELACLNMVRQGLFGTVVNVEGGYKHDLRDEICYGEKNRHYRLKEYMSRNADNYPTHEIGPIAKLLDINRGNRFVSLRSLASKSAGLKEFVSRGDDEYLNKLRDVEFKQGDVVHTLIECANGETVHIVLDTCLPRPYSRGFTVQGTKGMYTEEGNYFYLDSKAAHLKSVIFGKSYNNGKRFVKKYAHPIWKKIRFASALGGHGGMDYLVLRAFIEAVAGGEPMPIDVYDAATWMAITALSAESIEKGGARVEFPDFTSGKWKERKPVAFCGYKI